jgi:hypothetical protein
VLFRSWRLPNDRRGHPDMTGAALFQGVLWVVWDGASFDVVQELIEDASGSSRARDLGPASGNVMRPSAARSRHQGLIAGL